MPVSDISAQARSSAHHRRDDDSQAFIPTSNVSVTVGPSYHNYLGPAETLESNELNHFNVASPFQTGSQYQQDEYRQSNPFNHPLSYHSMRNSLSPSTINDHFSPEDFISDGSMNGLSSYSKPAMDSLTESQFRLNMNIVDDFQTIPHHSNTSTKPGKPLFDDQDQIKSSTIYPERPMSRLFRAFAALRSPGIRTDSSKLDVSQPRLSRPIPSFDLRDTNNYSTRPHLNHDLKQGGPHDLEDDLPPLQRIPQHDFLAEFPLRPELPGKQGWFEPAFKEHSKSSLGHDELKPSPPSLRDPKLLSTFLDVTKKSIRPKLNAIKKNQVTDISPAPNLPPDPGFNYRVTSSQLESVLDIGQLATCGHSSCSDFNVCISPTVEQSPSSEDKTKRSKQKDGRVGLDPNTTSFRCALQSCKAHSRIWLRRDTFKQHVMRVHKDEDVNKFIARSEVKGMVHEGSTSDLSLNTKSARLGINSLAITANMMPAPMSLPLPLRQLDPLKQYQNPYQNLPSGSRGLDDSAIESSSSELTVDNHKPVASKFSPISAHQLVSPIEIPSSDDASDTGSDLSCSEASSEYLEERGSELQSAQERKLALVNSLMKFFFFGLNTAFRSHSPNNQRSRNSKSAANDSVLPSVVGAAVSNSLNNSRKHGREDGPGREHESDEEDDDRRKEKCPKHNDKPELQPGSRKLACPYFKRNPQKFHIWRQCPGPGWDTVHRLKEHLYRRHALPIQCNRCRGQFTSEDLLNEHQREVRSCEMREEEPAEGFNKGQEKQLRSRKKARPDMSEEEKWFHVYTILFPDDEPLDIPSPFYELYEKQDGEVHEAPDSAEFAQYERFLRDELPARVREQLVVVVERELEPVEERLRIQLPDIVRIVQRELFQFFQQSRNLLDPTISEAPDALVLSVPSAQPQDLLQPLAYQLAAEDNQLGLFWDDSFASAFPDIDGFGFSFDAPNSRNGDEWSDPGYGTTLQSSSTGLSENPSEQFSNTEASSSQEQKKLGMTDFDASISSTLDARPTLS